VTQQVWFQTLKLGLGRVKSSVWCLADLRSTSHWFCWGCSLPLSPHRGPLLLNPHAFFMLHASCFSRNPLPLTLHTEQFVLWPSRRAANTTAPIRARYTRYTLYICNLSMHSMWIFVHSLYPLCAFNTCQRIHYPHPHLRIPV